MSVDESEQRGLERRVFELEQKMSRVLTLTAVTEAKVDGLVETIKSRFAAFDRGIELILEKFKPFEGVSPLEVAHRVTALEEIKNKAEGALLLAKILGWTGVVGGVVAIVKLIKG